MAPTLPRTACRIHRPENVLDFAPGISYRFLRRHTSHSSEFSLTPILKQGESEDPTVVRLRINDIQGLSVPQGLASAGAKIKIGISLLFQWSNDQPGCVDISSCVEIFERAS